MHEHNWKIIDVRNYSASSIKTTDGQICPEGITLILYKCESCGIFEQQKFLGEYTREELETEKNPNKEFQRNFNP